MFKTSYFLAAVFFFLIAILGKLWGEKPIAIEEPSKKDLWTTVLLDLAIPGYGPFSQKKYLWGGIYGSLKIGGIFLIYYSYQNYRYQDSIARAAEKRQKEEYDLLYFRHPRGDFLTAQEIRNEAQRAYTFFTYAVLGEILIYTLSAIHTYHWHYESALSKAFSYELSQKEKEVRHDLSWKIRF